MTNAKLIQKIRNEIERLYDGEAPKHDQQCDFDDGYYTGIGAISKFLSTLESEKPMDLGERIGSYNIVPYIDDKIAKLQDMWREEKVSFDWDDLKDMIEDVARHFAEWGVEHLKK